MEDSEVDLWPVDIDVDALSPLMILNQQAEILAKRTKGLVRGDISIDERTDEVSEILFDLLSPAASYRQRILTIRQSGDLVYPALITSHVFVDLGQGITPEFGDKWSVDPKEIYLSRLAYTPKALENYLSLIFSSLEVKAIILSLIARSNQLQHSPERRK